MPSDLRMPGKFDRGEAVAILVDGEPVAAFRGESVAAALLAAGRLRLRTSPRGNPRGAFCFMGICQECTVEHDGQAKPSCQLACEDGMAISLRRFSDPEH